MLKEGDTNSKIFHTSLTVKRRRRRNIIHVIKDKQFWIQGLKGISDYLIQNFKELFQSSHPLITNELEVLGMKEITDLENTMLLNIPTTTYIYIYI